MPSGKAKLRCSIRLRKPRKVDIGLANVMQSSRLQNIHLFDIFLFFGLLFSNSLKTGCACFVLFLTTGAYITPTSRRRGYFSLAVFGVNTHYVPLECLGWHPDIELPSPEPPRLHIPADSTPDHHCATLGAGQPAKKGIEAKKKDAECRSTQNI